VGYSGSRYEFLNALESKQQEADRDLQEARAKKSKKKKKKEEEEKEADRATLWQALTQLEQSSREQLESLYWDEVSNALPRLKKMRRQGADFCVNGWSRIQSRFKTASSMPNECGGYCRSRKRNSRVCSLIHNASRNGMRS